MVTLEQMKGFLSSSLSSVNKNKLRGMLAEIKLREHLDEMGFGDNISAGGWIARSVIGPEQSKFAENTVALFPETIMPGRHYGMEREFPDPSYGLHTICATMHQIGIRSFFCAPAFPDDAFAGSVVWNTVELGIPNPGSYSALDTAITGFTRRSRRYNFMKNHSEVEAIPDFAVPEEFTKELLRVRFQESFMAEISDIDGILWGKEHTYPLEIKEKTPGVDKKVGEYFGLDIGPFVKLAFYAAKRGNLHSIFVVREIDDEDSRNLVEWRFITFDVLAQYASWVFGGGGTNMQGGMSSVVKIPKSRFSVLDRSALASL